MEAGSLYQRRMQNNAGYALVEVLVDLSVDGWRALALRAASFLHRHRQAQARRELHRLSDHFLKDIGLERSQIDRLFR